MFYAQAFMGDTITKALHIYINGLYSCIVLYILRNNIGLSHMLQWKNQFLFVFNHEDYSRLYILYEDHAKLHIL